MPRVSLRNLLPTCPASLTAVPSPSSASTSLHRVSRVCYREADDKTRQTRPEGCTARCRLDHQCIVTCVVAGSCYDGQAVPEVLPCSCLSSALYMLVRQKQHDMDSHPNAPSVRAGRAGTVLVSGLRYTLTVAISANSAASHAGGVVWTSTWASQSITISFDS